MDYSEYRQEIYVKTEELNQLISSYWNAYSSFDSWQFWVTLLLFVLPLVILYFVVDRKRIFEVFFYGFTVHTLWTYASILLENHNLMAHTYFPFPALPFSLNVTTSMLPIGFLLVYQYTTKYRKNFYMYSILLSVVFAFGFATVEEGLGLIEFYKGTNNFHLFLIDIAVAFLAYWFTLFIKRLGNNHAKE